MFALQTGLRGMVLLSPCLRNCLVFALDLWLLPEHIAIAVVISGNDTKFRAQVVQLIAVKKKKSHLISCVSAASAPNPRGLRQLEEGAVSY